jgi:putative cell wall-binding protein
MKKAKNIIIDDVTDEQKEILQEDINKKKLRDIDLFLGRVETPNKDIEKAPIITYEWEAYNKFLELFKEKGNIILEELKREIKWRKETKLIHSQTDFDHNFACILQDFIYELWESKWEEVLKEYLYEQIEAIESNVFNKTEELYDAPVFSKFDLLKRKKNEYLLLSKRIEIIRNSFSTQIQKLDNPNPYED